MRTVKYIVFTVVLCLCAPAAFAQKQFKYVPRALEGTKKVPYVITPQLPPAVRARFARPV